MEQIDITIIGAGVIGLAVAAELSKVGQKDIFVIEKNYAFGQETSSRNSEVIHAGIYYPKNSLKAKTCVEGRHLLYEFCQKNNINHKKLGKLIVTIDDSEITELEELFKKGKGNGVDDLCLLNREEIKRIEPHIKTNAAIHSPSTGIIDSHSLMKKLASDFKSRGGEISYNTELTNINKIKDGFKLRVKDNNGEEFTFNTKVLINCAGLNSYQVSKLAGLDKKEYELKYCKGDYFRVGNNKSKFVNGLVYPVPKKDRGGLGIHATLDLGGNLRLGPDDEYIDKIDYIIADSKGKFFHESAASFLPFIEADDLYADTAGIRPKLQGKGQDFRDFIIKEESENNLPELINLIGIESPGLTACLAIARIVNDMVKIL
jgi:L-2-hydroxyglutarate oxidase LhgO